MTSYLRSTQAMKIGVLKKIGEMIDGSSTYEQNGTVLDYLQKANLRVLAGGNEFIRELSKPWPWAIQPTPIYITLQPANTSIAIGVTAQSTTCTLSSAPLDWNGNQISIQGWWVNITGYPEWFKIAAHVAGQTTATLDMGWTDVTLASAGCTIVQLEYMIQDQANNGIMRLAQSLKVYRPQDLLGDQEYSIYLADEAEMLREFPIARMRCVPPVRFAITQKTPQGVTLRFNSYPQYATRVEVRFIANPVPLLDTPGRQFNATVTIATPGVFTGPIPDVASGYPGYNLVNGDPFTLSTTGALPTGLTAGVTYYCVNTAGNTFQASLTAGGSAINTTGTQFGIMTVNPAQAPTYSLVPIEYGELLEYIAAYWIKVDKNDSQGAQEYMTLAVAMGNALIAGTQKEKSQTSKNRGRIIPRQDTYIRGRKNIVQSVT